jgi:ribonuclease E
MNRATYIESLRVERAAIASRPAEHPARARRLADIDAELDRYANEPAEPRIETAVAAPVVAASEPVVEPAPDVVEPPAAPVAKTAAKRAPAKKAAAKKTAAKRAPAKKAAAKKTAAK